MSLFALPLAGFLLLGPVAPAAAADNLEDVYQRLQEAQTANNADVVKTAAVDLMGITCEIVMSPAPADESEKKVWANRVERAKSAQLFAEYALVSAALKSQPPVLIDLISTLELQNPKSQYLDEAYGPYLVALAGTSGGAKKAVAVAEKALPNFPENEDLLLLMTTTAMGQKQPDRALVYANRLIAVLNKHPKPQNIAAAQWERKKELSLGQAYWTAGVVLGEKGQYLNADKDLRAALPLVKENQAMLAPALFYLGTANYQIGKMTLSKEKVLEGAKFSEQCATIQSAYADQARHNALVMKSEAAKMR